VDGVFETRYIGLFIKLQRLSSRIVEWRFSNHCCLLRHDCPPGVTVWKYFAASSVGTSFLFRIAL